MATYKIGPQTPMAEQLHSQKYRSEGESYRDSINRVASALKDDDAHFRQIKEITEPQRFMFAGRIQAAMGSPRIVTALNCYVSGAVEDSFVAGEGSIMQRATEAAATMRMGGGIGYDFSQLRPRGDLIAKLQSRSSGPISFMDIFDAVCRCTASSGHRRGAQMATFRVDHPDIEEFVNCKHTLGKLEGFNISVAVTDKFMRHLLSGRPFPLVFQGKTYKEIDPVALWESIMRSTWDWGEPGVVFIDTMNRMNNLWYCEELISTNPCGEQPLPAFGSCLLGSFNLTKYLYPNGRGGWGFDEGQLIDDVSPIVRAMDNVIDRARYPLPAQQKEMMSKRRIGLGICGLANAAEAQGWSYGSRQFLEFEHKVLRIIRDASYMASIEMAREKGAFPMFDSERYLQGAFIRSLPENIRSGIYKHGIRNSHLTSIAPTGTISMCADNCSSGIEPVFAHEVKRTIIEFGGPREIELQDYAVANFGVRGRKAADVSAKDHLAVVTAAVPYIDAAISKTCNVRGDMPWLDFKDLYLRAYEAGAKGLTTFNADGKRGGVLEDSSKAENDSRLHNSPPEPIAQGELCFFDPVTGRRECS